MTMFPYTKEAIASKIKTATSFFWTTLQSQEQNQERRGVADAGRRGQVTGGKQLDGFAKLIREIGLKAGCRESNIFFNSKIPLPGYYRPQKNWDVVFMHDGKLLAAIELKSQSTSFGNNFNNRSEEVVGASRDFWIAYRERAFGINEAPWLGYLFVIGDCEESSRPVRLKKSPLQPFPIFNETSYQRRYEILFERLVLERDYTATSLIVSKKEDRSVRDGGPRVTAYSFLKSLYLHLATQIQA